MAFFECEFPRSIAYAGQTGGPISMARYSTIVNKGFSGFEARNRNWKSARRVYQLDLVGKTQGVYASLLAFFHAVSGMSDSFRFFDMTDFQINGITPCSPAVGDGNNKVFQMQQQYVVGSGANARTVLRTISKPIMSHQSATFNGSGVNYNSSALITDFSGIALLDTVAAYLNGINQPGTNNYTIDATTGLITFATAPGVGVAVASTGQFDTPVRFDSDDWPAQVRPSDWKDSKGLIDVTGINLLEVLIQAGQSQG